MCQPLTVGNFIVFKGHKQSSGKSFAINGAIKSFLDRNVEGRVIHVSLTAQSASSIVKGLDNKHKDRVAIISSVE